MLKLEPRNEYLRDTLFWHMFRNTLLFKDFADAVRYGRDLANDNKPAQSMYSEDGQQVLADGILDPNAVNPSKLDFVFGMQSPCNTTLFADIKSGKLLFICGFLLLPFFMFRDSNHMEIIWIVWSSLLCSTL